MSEKPQKRLVNKQHYLGTLLEKGGLSFFAVALGIGGFVLCLFSVVLLLLGVFPIIDTLDKYDRVLMLGLAGFFGVGCVGTLWFAKAVLKKVQNIEQVELITRHNTGLLPEAETLVRGSDSPSKEAVELLRAAGQGQETPAEQLLRAFPEKRQDV